MGTWIQPKTFISIRCTCDQILEVVSSQEGYDRDLVIRVKPCPRYDEHARWASLEHEPEADDQRTEDNATYNRTVQEGLRSARR